MTVLVFTVAHNGYAGAYASCIRSQRAYAERQGYTYVAVTRPWRVKEPALSAWLKVPLMAAALRGGWSWVAFIDADAEVRATAPDLRGLGTPEGSVHIALGRSGRLNSGVMIAEADDRSRGFFDDVVASATRSIPEEDRAGLKYENGNVIHVARSSEAIVELPLTWNNTYSPDLADHVRHYTGPLREEHAISRAADLAFRARKAIVRSPTGSPDHRDDGFAARLAALTDWCHRTYPALASSSS